MKCRFLSSAESQPCCYCCPSRYALDSTSLLMVGVSVHELPPYLTNSHRPYTPSIYTTSSGSGFAERDIFRYQSQSSESYGWLRIRESRRVPESRWPRWHTGLASSCVRFIEPQKRALAQRPRGITTTTGTHHQRGKSRHAKERSTRRRRLIKGKSVLRL